MTMSWTSDATALIASLHRRIYRFALDSDPTGVLDPQALADGRELFAIMHEHRGGATVEVVQVLARLHWSRYEASPAGTADEDRDQAQRLFIAIRDIDARMLPPALRPRRGGDLG